MYPGAMQGHKKFRAEYKKIRDKRETTRQGQYPEQEYFDAMHKVIGAKHLTEPPVVLESFTDSQTVESMGLAETQDMSREVVDEGSTSPAASHSSGGHSSSTGSHSSGTVHTSVDGDTHASGGKGKSKKRKLCKREATNESLEKMIDMQMKSDKLTVDLEEKRMRLGERQM